MKLSDVNQEIAIQMFKADDIDFEAFALAIQTETAKRCAEIAKRITNTSSGGPLKVAAAIREEFLEEPNGK